MKFFWCQEFFSGILISKIGDKMNLMIKTKNHAADPKIGFLTKLILKPNDNPAAMSTAWELKN